ncbi:MAG: N-acetylmuramoyl-L-alanine amidase [Candidatus Omnitrophota bacterium]|jgi:N-acetylmuramoyl-L-alanine amidase
MPIQFKILKAPILFIIIALFICGCATLPARETLPVYRLKGVTYVPLASLCEQKNIRWEYDTFTRTALLSKDAHEISLSVGDTLIVVNSKPTHLRHPMDIYQGQVVVPYRFKEQILDVLFKEPLARARARFPIAAVKKIVIDAGHGGNDPGAIGRTGLREKDVNLDIAKRLVNLLKDEGVEVVMTRSGDTFVSLERRVQIANNSGADIFISIHANANRVKALNGLEVYYVSPRVSDSQRALDSAKATVLDLDRSYFSSPTLNLKATLWDMIYTYNRAESIELARSICRRITSDVNTKVLGIKGAGFYVLKGAQMPAILVETGFLSNREEERLLRNGYYRQQVAEAIKDGIGSYAAESILAEVN